MHFYVFLSLFNAFRRFSVILLTLFHVFLTHFVTFWRIFWYFFALVHALLTLFITFSRTFTFFHALFHALLEKNRWKNEKWLEMGRQKSFSSSDYRVFQQFFETNRLVIVPGGQTWLKKSFWRVRPVKKNPKFWGVGYKIDAPIFSSRNSKTKVSFLAWQVEKIPHMGVSLLNTPDLLPDFLLFFLFFLTGRTLQNRFFNQVWPPGAITNRFVSKNCWKTR